LIAGKGLPFYKEVFWVPNFGIGVSTTSRAALRFIEPFALLGERSDDIFSSF